MHALQILECVARHDPSTTASEISADRNVSRATTDRLVRLLADDEYLVRMPGLRGFALGRRVAELAAPAALTPPLSRAARAVLAVLRDRVRAGVHLVHSAGSGIVITDADLDIPLTDPHRPVTDPGSTATGRLAAAWTAAQHAGHRPPPTCSSSGTSPRTAGAAHRGCLAPRVPRAAGAGRRRPPRRGRPGGGSGGASRAPRGPDRGPARGVAELTMLLT